MAFTLNEADHELVSKLSALSKKNKKLVNSTAYKTPAIPEMTVRSWKMNEFKYYDVPSPFPTLARGLFTTWVSDDPKSEEGDGRGKYRIVARGYDKFFNMGEVPWTTWAALEQHTSPPYVMTLKSNGCIIFIAPLSPTKLVVTSKHSLGAIQNAKVSHAQMGEIWLEKLLEGKGRSVEELAGTLWQNNWTAVAELCDDSFEEHVLPYPPEKTGLHLHGINETTGAFKTLPSDKVTQFARDWGFIETPYHTVNSIEEVRAFSDEIAKAGKWNGESIEGFVVRCHVSESSTKDRNAPPYRPGSSFFFKVKYDEPYMMYRDWREITKMLLSAKGPIRDVSIPKSKLRRPESQLYLKWVRDEIMRDRKQFATYSQGKGIIATRQRFLDWLEATKSGSDPDQLVESMKELAISGKQDKEFVKTIIMPIAIPGSGKTAVSVALKHLFGFGHVQSDDIQAKKPAPIFLKKVADELRTHDVVIADKNNHLKQHRQGLRQVAEQFRPPARLMALYWALDKPPAMVHRICGDRVLGRGDNHQSLVGDEEMKHEEVIWMFIQKTEELEDDEVDEIVEMDIEDDLERMVDRAVDACVRVLGMKKPTPEEIGMALAAARSYVPAKKAEPQTQVKKKGPSVRYYALLPEINLESVAGDRLGEEDVPEQAKKLWETIVNNKRITHVPHVTLVHRNALPGEQELWDRCQHLFLHNSPPSFEFDVGHLVYDNRLMALTVDNLRAASNPDEDTSKDALDFVSWLKPEFTSRLHVTVGTRSKDVNPFDARALVSAWRAGTASADVGALSLTGLTVKGRIKGMNQ